MHVYVYDSCTLLHETCHIMYIYILVNIHTYIHMYITYTNVIWLGWLCNGAPKKKGLFFSFCILFVFLHDVCFVYLRSAPNMCSIRV